MKIAELLAGKKNGEQVTIDGLTIPVAVLKALEKEGYQHATLFKDNRTFACWGDACSACFTQESLRERTRSK
ncbi:conserved hypothetical protein [uncultured Desulfatiglans sp.]|uniref:Uncharacterized protein n=1 Tax=Uncultured Desulfatiglans sp. TaxID=1748965 RepID=A0A653A7E7_UNCDX|nr:conserved hypothetical protein [uncultured Desulfatiglans sp.]